MPAIEGLETNITMNLGRNISYDFYIQSYSQFEKNMEKDIRQLKETAVIRYTFLQVMEILHRPFRKIWEMKQ